MKLLVVRSTLVCGALVAVGATSALAAGGRGLMGESSLRMEASAEPSASDKETARSLYESGDKAFKAKNFTAARKDFEAAYALVPVPSTADIIAAARDLLQF